MMTVAAGDNKPKHHFCIHHLNHSAFIILSKLLRRTAELLVELADIYRN